MNRLEKMFTLSVAMIIDRKLNNKMVLTVKAKLLGLKMYKLQMCINKLLKIEFYFKVFKCYQI